VAENVCWDPANKGQKLGLVWKIEKISQIIRTFAYCSPSYLFYAYKIVSLSHPISQVRILDQSQLGKAPGLVAMGQSLYTLSNVVPNS
jgi:hypothetical protein